MTNDDPKSVNQAKLGDVAKETAVGCITHFLLGTTAFAFLGGAAVYKGWIGRILFGLAALVLFVGAVMLPRRKRQDK